MMGIIIDQYHLISLQMEIETAARSGKCSHTLFQILRFHSVQPSDRHSRYPVLYINLYGNT